MKKGFGYELMCLLSCFLILFSSCGSSLPQDIQPEPAPINSKPAVVRPQWFWQGAWWGTTGALAPEAITTIQQNPWILSGARLARQAALGVSDAPAFDFQGARQIWNEQAQRLSILIPFVGDTSPYGAIVNIAPVFFWFGEHEKRISSVSYGGFSKTQTASGRVYPQGLNLAAAIQDKVVFSSVIIKPTGQLGEANMAVASRATGQKVNWFSTRAPVTTQVQIKSMFNPKLTAQALVIVECAFASESNPRNLPICPVTPITPGKDYSVPPSGTPQESQPIVNPPVNCNDLAQQVNSLAAASTRAYANLIGNIMVGAGACVLSAVTAPNPASFAVFLLVVTICAGGGTLIWVAIDGYQEAQRLFEDKSREYVAQCT